MWAPGFKVLNSEKVQVCSPRFILAHDVTYPLEAVLGPGEATEEELEAASPHSWPLAMSSAGHRSSQPHPKHGVPAENSWSATSQAFPCRPNRSPPISVPLINKRITNALLWSLLAGASKQRPFVLLHLSASKDRFFNSPVTGFPSCPAF